MGSGSSASAGYKAKLDGVEGQCNDNPTGEGCDGLDVMEDAARILYTVMEDIITAGGRDEASLTRIELLSERILTNLESRITAELVATPECNDTWDRLRAVAEELNKVRANRATDIIDKKFKDLGAKGEADIAADIEAANQKVLEKADAFQALVDQPDLKPPDLLKAMMALVAAWPAEGASDAATARVAEVYEALRHRLSDLVAQAAGCDDAKKIAAVIGFAAKFDKMQEDLGTASPGFIAGISRSGAHADLDDIEKEVAKAEDCDWKAIVRSARQFPLYWPHLGEDDDELGALKERFTAVGESVQRRTFEEFDAALAANDAAKGKFLGGFSNQWDTCMKDVPDHGLPELAAGLRERQRLAKEGGGERLCLAKVEAFQAELDKEDGLHLQVFFQALTELVEVWPAEGAREALTARLAELYANLKQRVDAAGADEDKKVAPLLAFFERYGQIQDDAGQISHAFTAAVARSGASADIDEIEVQIAKAEGMDFNHLLTSARQLRLYWPQLGEEDDELLVLKGWLATVCEATRTSVGEAFDKCLASGDATKGRQLGQLANHWDVAMRAIPDLGAPELTPDLQQRTRYFREHGAPRAAAPVEAAAAPAAGPGDGAEAALLQKVERVEAELSKEEGLKPLVIYDALQELEEMWPEEGASEAVTASLREQFETLRRRLTDACRVAASQDEGKKVQALMAFAQQFDSIQRSLGGLCPAFKVAVARSGAAADTGDIEAEAEKGAAMDAKHVVKSAHQLQLYWPHLGEEDDELLELQERLAAACEGVRTQLCHDFDVAVAAKDGAKGKMLGQIANQWDRSLKGIPAGGPPLTPLLQQRARAAKG